MKTNKITTDEARETIHEIGKTFSIKQLTDYHFRVEDTVDLFPARKRYHNIKNDERGDWPADVLPWITSILRPEIKPSICKIYKETCSVYRNQFQEFPLPKGAVILSFQVQNNNLVFWYRFDETEKETQVRTFIYALTGQSFHYRGEQYLTTVQVTPDYVVHIFELINK